MKSRDITRVSGMYRCMQSETFALAHAVLNGLRSEVSSHVRACLFGSHLSLLNLSVDPSTYSNPEDFRDDYLAVEMLSKYPYLDVKIDRESVALKKFEEAEMRCSETNLRLSSTKASSIRTVLTPDSVFHLVRLKISALLGPFNWDHAEQHFGFGPGSTTSLPKSLGDAYFKFGSSSPHVTKACSILALCAIQRIPSWYSSLLHSAGESPESVAGLGYDDIVARIFTIVPGNRVTTVPKNAKVDRVIAIEPDLNMFIQKGIGGLIRSKLKRVGVDLNNQVPNQVAACEGSRDGSLATIDLSSASDTVSMRLCERLLPDDWCEAIKLCRSPRGVLPCGKVITYHKVSSMGNGFTFELESLLFWAICKSVLELFGMSKGRLLVYGDDIIVPSSSYHSVVWMLEYSGFTVNTKKSFNTGPFRESCGKHYFLGVDVTPFYIRDDVNDPSRLIWFANSVRRWARLPIYGLDGRLFQAYNRAVRALPSALRRPTIPDGYGDIALIGDFDEARPSRTKHLWSWEAIGVGDVRPTKKVDGVPYLLRSLSKLECGLGSSSAVECIFDARRLQMGFSGRSSKLNRGATGVVLHSRRPRWKVVKLSVTQWASYGPWLRP